MRVLIVEDDRRTAGHLRQGLSESGHTVDWVCDGEAALTIAPQGVHDVWLVDRRLPGMDGIALVERLRRARIVVPVLMLSGVGSAADRVAGLQAGCDDYLAKPYAFSEVLARLEGLVRRHDPGRSTRVLRVADLVLDTATREATRGGQALRLQRREGLILEVLMRRPGQIVTRLMLVTAVWPLTFELQGNIVDMHIHRLRRKVDAPPAAPLIHTHPGAGYSLGVRSTVRRHESEL